MEALQKLCVSWKPPARPPPKRADEIEERLLFARLEAIRANPQQRERLLPFDEYGLLKDVAKLPDEGGGVCQPR